MWEVIVPCLDGLSRLLCPVWWPALGAKTSPLPAYQNVKIRPSVDGLCYSCTMAARGLRGMREWRRYIDHEGGARVGL